MFEHLVVPQTLDTDISRETILSFGLDKKGEITLEEKGFLYDKIFKGNVSILTHQQLIFSEIPESFQHEGQVKPGQLVIINQDVQQPPSEDAQLRSNGLLCLDHASQMWDYKDLFDVWYNLRVTSRFRKSRVSRDIF